jgi:hypothetical protein
MSEDLTARLREIPLGPQVRVRTTLVRRRAAGVYDVWGRKQCGCEPAAHPGCTLEQAAGLIAPRRD